MPYFLNVFFRFFLIFFPIISTRAFHHLLETIAREKQSFTFSWEKKEENSFGLAPSISPLYLPGSPPSASSHHPSSGSL